MLNVETQPRMPPSPPLQGHFRGDAVTTQCLRAFLHFCAVTKAPFVTSGKVDLDQCFQRLSPRHGGPENSVSSAGNPVEIPANGQRITMWLLVWLVGLSLNMQQFDFNLVAVVGR